MHSESIGVGGGPAAWLPEAGDEGEPGSPAPPYGRTAGNLRWIRAAHHSGLQLIPVAEVCYFRSDLKYTCVATTTQECLIRLSVCTLARQLDPDTFWRVHRSIIVNVAGIARVQRDWRGHLQIHLRNRSEVLPVSRPYAGLFRQM